MPRPYAACPGFERLLRGELPADLLEVAFEIARDAYPDLDSAPYLERVEELAARLRARCPRAADHATVLRHLNWLLYVEEGFAGNQAEYDDPRNSYLNEVLDRKLGIPISLAVLYQALARRVGVALAGVNLPGHYMLRLDLGDRALFVDAFNQGVLLDREGCRRRVQESFGAPVELTPAHLEPCSPRQTVIRMLGNLKRIFLARGDLASLVPVQGRLAALRPEEPEEERDLGLYLLCLERPGAALGPLERFLARTTSHRERERFRKIVTGLRREIAAAN